MARCRLVDANPQFLSIDFARQLLPGTFEHALDHEVDLAYLGVRFGNDASGAPAGLLLKVMLIACSPGLVRSRAIERVCQEDVTFMTLCGMTAPHFTTIVHFVSTVRDEIA